MRLGDREMDLAFAVGAREAQEHPAALSAEAKEAQIRLQDAENSLDRDNSRVAQLTSALAKATGARADSLDNQLQQAKVQVELDQDEVDNAKQELILAGGDAQGRIEELTKEHEVVVDNKANVREYVSSTRIPASLSIRSRDFRTGCTGAPTMGRTCPRRRRAIRMPPTGWKDNPSRPPASKRTT